MSEISGARLSYSDLAETHYASRNVVSGADGWLIDPATYPSGFKLCWVNAMINGESAPSGNVALILHNAVPATAADGSAIFEADSALGMAGGVAAGLDVEPGYGLYVKGTANMIVFVGFTPA